MQALYDAMDGQRRERGLSWVELAREINGPFKHTPSIPIHLTTLRGITQKDSVTSAVVLQILRWLRRSPEDFLRPTVHAFDAYEDLPHAEPYQVLRFRTRSLYKALEKKRTARGMTWSQVAAVIPGFTPAMLRNLANGPLIGFPRVMRITQWLGIPSARFVKACSR